MLRKIEDLDNATEWQRVEKKLREELERVEKVQSEVGNEKTARLVEQLRPQVDQVIRGKDVRAGRETLERINDLFVQITLLYQCIGLIRHYHTCFSGVRWKDAARARHLIDRGLEEIASRPRMETLQPIAADILDLLPDSERGNAEGLLK